MIVEIIKALIFAALPLFIVSAGLLGWMRQSEVLDQFNDHKELKSAIKSVKKQRKLDKNKSLKKKNIFVDKWFYFGGGFYGLMALMTYAYIEVAEIIDFIGKLFSFTLSELFSAIGFQTLINFLVNALVNLISAFVWFGYWPSEINMNEPLIWLLLAYLGYWYGAKFSHNVTYASKDDVKAYLQRVKSKLLNRG